MRRARGGRGAVALAAACAAVLGGCATAPADGGGAGLAQQPVELAARLPADAAGFRRGLTVPLGDRAGREVAYATPGRTAAGATVEVFRPDGQVVDEAAATAAFEQLMQDTLRPQPSRVMQERRRFRLPAAGSASGSAPGSALGPPLLRCAETAGSYGRERVQGLLCAGVVRGSLLRLRVAMPQREPPAADAEAFATAILDALRG